MLVSGTGATGPMGGTARHLVAVAGPTMRGHLAILRRTKAWLAAYCVLWLCERVWFVKRFAPVNFLL